MTEITTMQVRKVNLDELGVSTTHSPEDLSGKILVRIERFGMTANNITYGVVGDRIGYWKFFPTEDDAFGVIPVWGIGVVEASGLPDITVGERLYGYWPMGSHAVLEPGRIDQTRFFDASEHRKDLAAVYNRYLRLSNDPQDDPATDDMRMVLWPLYATSFCLYDFALAGDWYGAEQVLIVSASSKTGIGTGYAFQADPDTPKIVGMTSAGNKAKVDALALYDQVLTYDQIEAELENVPTLIIDMSGSGPVISRLHQHLGDNMRFTSHVGLTHYSEAGMGDGYIRERSEMFFAPGHIAKRNADWGPGEFERRSGDFWSQAMRKSADWLTINHAQGLAQAESAYREVLGGKTPADQAWTISLTE
ncbi:DUF2855 family protein [Falsiruegeria mediterranea]|uniref:DUF2855 domain-containing protein n=1 Tax=Falsiruegeria mediterranea M17 TaxID=1200281 RepID=A0A2R8CEV4_9RHOB|nr:DUF2855 family protein [Falsiruegeria mediterranea]SPJ30982.1 hypothetical protein TRM7615_04519 [Falsiruegeria mediterranea M17]